MSITRETRRVRRARRVARTLLEHRGRNVAHRISPFWKPDRRLRGLPVRFAADGDWWYRRIDLPAERVHARWVAAHPKLGDEGGLFVLFDRIDAVVHFTRRR